MADIQSELEQIIFNVAEGDLEFKQELTCAIYNGLIELKNIYEEAAVEKNEYKIQQIRHKLKPTLVMFEFNSVMKELIIGKELLDQNGFDQSFYHHYSELQQQLKIAISLVHSLTQDNI